MKKLFGNYYVGIDLGGTNIVAGVVDDHCNIISRSSMKTNAPRPANEIGEDLGRCAIEAIKSSGIDQKRISWIGIGIPAIVDKKTGIIVAAGNLGLYNAPIIDSIQKYINKPIFVENDANAAAYGEYIAGSAKGYENVVCITLGTGVGSGIIISGRIHNCLQYAGTEVGHMVINVDGAECSCGRKGCFEAYSSATGLVNIAKKYLSQNSNSNLRQTLDNGNEVITPELIFKANREGDKLAHEILDTYIKYLSIGISNIINVLKPDVVCIGGGVSNAGDNLLLPLIERVNQENYSHGRVNSTKIVLAKLGNDAGLIGAAFLGKETNLYKRKKK